MSRHERSTHTTDGAATAPRLPGTLRLGIVHLRVADLDRSVAFYESAIGLRLHRRADAVAAMGVGEEDLLVLHEQSGARAARAATRAFTTTPCSTPRAGSWRTRRCASPRREPPYRVPPTTAPTRRSTFLTPTETGSSSPQTARARRGRI